MARKGDAEFKIGVDAQDIRALIVRVVLIEAVRTGDVEGPELGKHKVMRPQRAVESRFGDVSGTRAQLNVIDKVTVDAWRFQVAVEGWFTFSDKVSRWELEGSDTRRMLVGVLLAQTCEVIAYLTAKVGMRPLILPPVAPDDD